MNPKLEVKSIPKYGKGVFALKKIKKGEILSIFGGHILRRVDEEKLPKNYRDEGVQISEDFVLGIIDDSGIEDASYFNHSCEPNAGFKGQIFLVAMNDISKNDEVAFDYGMVLFRTKGSKKYKLECCCGAKKCRKFITDNDWKIKDLQRRYDGYFQWYLQEKIDKIKRNNGL